MLVAWVTTIAVVLSTAPDAAGAQAGGPRVSREAEPEPDGFIGPSWLVMPQPDYPDAALRASSEGDALVQCIVQTDGSADACQIVSEAPAGMGFGEAVLAAMPAARWTPATINGVPVERSVRFRSPFTLAPTMKAPAEMQEVFRAIGAEGYASGACRHLLSDQLVARWDALQQEMDDRPGTVYRAYDQVFVGGYRLGRQDAVERGRPSSSDCAAIDDWAREVSKAARPAYAKLDAKSLPEERAQWRPMPD